MESPTEVVLSSPEEVPEGEGDPPEDIANPLQGALGLAPDLVEDVDFGLLDRARNLLTEQGMGTLELATQGLEDSEAIAKQIAVELGLPCPGYLAEAVLDWIQEAKKQSKLLLRSGGALAGDLEWRQISPPVEKGKASGPMEQEWQPPPGERNRKLLEDGFISQAREERLQELWVLKLKTELKEIDAPVLGKLQGSLDPDRAANLLVGRTRSSTLKRYLTYYKHWRLWLGEAKLRLPPGRPADLVDYLLSRRDEPCGRTVPEALLKAIAWVENVAEYPLELRATHGRMAWAAKDRIVEELSEGAPLIKRAPRYPVYMLAQMEGLVVDDGQLVGLRVWAWGKLLKVWGTLRWADLQAIIPGELSLVEGRLVTTLRKTKTSGASRRVKEAARAEDGGVRRRYGCYGLDSGGARTAIGATGILDGT